MRKKGRTNNIQRIIQEYKANDNNEIEIAYLVEIHDIANDNTAGRFVRFVP
jgi:hypothetical protein